MENFYISVSSNLKTSHFPKNKISHFKFQLPKPIDLFGFWEVALIDIAFPQTWYNVSEEMSIIKVTSSDGTVQSIQIPYGFYKCASDLLEVINNQLPDYIRSISYDFRQEKIRVKLFKGQAIFFHIKLAQMLRLVSNYLSYDLDNKYGGEYLDKAQRRGLNILSAHERRPINYKIKIKKVSKIKNQVINNTEENHDTIVHVKNKRRPRHSYIRIYSKNTINMNHHIDSLYIYSNIINNTIIGNIEAPILRIVPKDNVKYLSDITKHILNRIYVKVKYPEIRVIEIMIRDNLGNMIDFKFGKVILTLHFRRIY